MSRQNDLLKNTVILGIGYAVPAIVSFLTLPLYTAFFTQTEYGMYDLITILLSLVMPTMTLQIKTSVFRFLIESRESEEERKYYISTAYLFTVLISFLSIAVLFVLLSGIDSLTKGLICFYIFQEVLIDLSKQTARGSGMLNKYIFSVTLHSVLLLVLAYLFLAVFKMGLNGLLIALNVALLVSNIYIFLSLGLKNYLSIWKYNTLYLKKMLRFSAPMVPNSISLWIVKLSDRLVVTVFLGIEANAIYSVANKIPSLLSQVVNVFNLSWQENASLAVNDKDVAEYYSDINQTTIDILLGTSAILIASLPFLFKILIKGAYEQAYNQMPILICGIFFSCLSSCYGSIYIALKKTKFIGVTSAIGAILNLVINILFINKIGLYAASLSTVISYCLIYFSRVVQLRKYIEIHLKWKKNCISFIVLLIICAIYYKQNSFGNMIAFLMAVIFFFILNKNVCKSFCSQCISKIERRKNGSK